VAYDRYDVNGFLGERKIHLYRLAYFQVALHQRSETTFADIQTDTVKRVGRRSRQLPQFKRYAEKRPLVSSRTYRRALRQIVRCNVHCSAHSPLIHLRTPSLEPNLAESSARTQLGMSRKSCQSAQLADNRENHEGTYFRVQRGNLNKKVKS